MGITRLIAAGRRLMFPTDRDLDDEKKRMTVSGEAITYEVIGKATPLEVVYIRVWCNRPWKYRTLAIDPNNARLLATTVAETVEQGRTLIEDELRAQKLIA